MGGTNTRVAVLNPAVDKTSSGESYVVLSKFKCSTSVTVSHGIFMLICKDLIAHLDKIGKQLQALTGVVPGKRLRNCSDLIV